MLRQLCKYGGFYGDSDTLPVWPLSSWPLQATLPPNWGIRPGSSPNLTLTGSSSSEVRRLDEVSGMAAGSLPPGPHVGAVVGWERFAEFDGHPYARPYQLVQVRGED